MAEGEEEMSEDANETPEIEGDNARREKCQKRGCW